MRFEKLRAAKMQEGSIAASHPPGTMMRTLGLLALVVRDPHNVQPCYLQLDHVAYTGAVLATS